MTCLEWSRQMAALREGELRLVAPEEDGLSMFARRSVYDLRDYLAALEQGYRRVCETLDGYRKREKVRPTLRTAGKPLQELVDKQWSEGACLGYAGMLLMQTGLDGADTRRGLVLLEELLRLYDLDEAARFYRDILDGKYDGGYQAPLLREERIAAQARTAPGPRRGPADGAEGVSGPMWASAPTEAHAMPLAASSPPRDDKRKDGGPSGTPAPTDGGPEWVGASAELKLDPDAGRKGCGPAAKEAAGC